MKMFCRLCLEESNKCFEIFCEHGETEIAKIITKYLNIEVKANDVYTKICSNCWQVLCDFNRFWLKVDEKQKTIQAHLACTQIKRDIEDSEVEISSNPHVMHSPIDSKNIELCENENDMVKEHLMAFAEQMESASIDLINDNTSMDGDSFARPFHSSDEMSDLIKSWHLNDEILQILNDRGILSSLVLQNLEMKDVEAIFDSLDSRFFGDKIKFKTGLTEWRNLMNIPFRSDRNAESINSKILSQLEKLSNDLHTIKCREYTPVSSETTSISYNVFDLLKSTVRGKFVLKFHEQNGYIDSKHQKTLTHCIAESYIGTGRKMCYSDMKHWANAICQIFPKEKPETYYLERKKGKKNPTGKLYSRWVNSCVKTTKSSNNESETEEESKFEHKQQQKQQETSHDFSKKKFWLMHNCTPWEQVKLYWKETSSMRINCKISLKDLLSDWPRYKDTNGYELIELDFEAMYPGKTNQLLFKLDNFYKKIVPILKRDVKDAASREVLLSKLDLDKHISNDSKYCITLLLLHCILQPMRRNRNEKPTIADAQNDFLALVSTPNDIKPGIFANKKETAQPRIVVVGTDFWDISEFYIYCDGLKWKCFSFMKCIEYIIKISHVFKIEYAHNSKQVWTFLEQYFFDLKSEMFSAVSSLLSKIDLP